MESSIKVPLSAKPQHESSSLRSVDSNSGPLYTLTWVCLLAVSLMAAFIGILAISRIVSGNGNRDFVEYWAAGKLLVQGADPYEAAATLRLERSAGANFGYPLIMPSPPVIFFLIAPLGLVGERTAAILSGFFLIASLGLSIHIVWLMLGRKLGLVHLFCFCLAPVLACLMGGQIGIFLLLGVVLFLRFHESQPFIAGMALLPCAFKPHLFVPVVIVLLVWVVCRRTYSILVGFGAAVVAACAVALLLDPFVWSQYMQSLMTAKLTEPFVPTLSKLFRLLIHRNTVWLQFVPCVLSCCWALWYFLTRRDRWNWMDQGMLLLLVSVACAPYSWYTDEAILLPAVLVGIYKTRGSGRSLLPFALIAAAPLVELLSWYLYESRATQQKSEILA
jgi:Glycosyltransferase family 87